MWTGEENFYILEWETHDKYFAFQPFAIAVGLALGMLGTQMFMVAATQIYWQTWETNFEEATE